MDSISVFGVKMPDKTIWQAPVKKVLIDQKYLPLQIFNQGYKNIQRFANINRDSIPMKVSREDVRVVYASSNSPTLEAKDLTIEVYPSGKS